MSSPPKKQKMTNSINTGSTDSQQDEFGLSERLSQDTRLQVNDQLVYMEQVHNQFMETPSVSNDFLNTTEANRATHDYGRSTNFGEDELMKAQPREERIGPSQTDSIYGDSQESYGENVDVSFQPIQEKKQLPYKFLTSKDILPEMIEATQKCSNVIGYPPTICRVLLHHFKWYDEAMVEKFFEYENLDAFFKKFGLVNQEQLLTAMDDYYGEECSICYQKLRLTCLECGHKFCYDCWNSYLEEQVISHSAPYIECPEYKCKLILSDEIARELMLKESTEKAYDNMIIRSFIESNRLLRWCPGKDCGRIVQLLEGIPTLNEGIECECKMIFCFACGLEWHEPMKCDLDKKWMKQVDDDKGTYMWLNTYTKDCPKCQAAIEKNGGCNHMTCRSAACRYEFCWICLKDWGGHVNSGGYNCNRYTEAEAAEKNKTRAAMERYLHYYNRFTNHQNSLKLEDKLKNEVAKQMLFLQDKGFSYIETCFMKDSIGILNRCRRTLSYTYGFAYYLVKSNQVDMFEDNQRDLELATEILSGFLEKDLQEMLEEPTNPGELKEKLAKFRRDVMDKAMYVDNRRKILLEYCMEGYEKDYWNFADSN